MSNMLQFVFAIILFVPIFVESKDHWTYENIQLWSHSNHYCGGNLQSPIDLRFNISHHDRRLKHIYLEEQYPRNASQLTNNGHTAQLNSKKHYILKHVTPHSEDYIVEQIHFHWGHSNDNTTGSEHLVEGRSYPLEMHVVTYSSLFSNIDEAVSNTRALAVVGVFFELSDEPNPLLKPLVNALAHITHKGQHTLVSEDFNIKELIGEKRMRRYYRYDGSLTTPPCYESVVWTVLQEPLKLSFDQLNAFRSLHDEKSKVMKNTYRPIQELGTRKLFRSFYYENIHDEPKKGISIIGNNGQYLSIDMKILFVLISLLMIIV